MKTIFIKAVLLLVTFSFYFFPAFGQSPDGMSYQAVIRNSGDALVTSTQIGMEINIRQGTPAGTIVYTETQTPTTNASGLVSIEIGGGTGFNTIDWSAGPYFIETKTAIAPPLTSYTITGTSQLLSVPYALHAQTAETISGGITETDPVFTAWDKDYNDLINQPAIPTVPTNVSAYSNDAGYLTSFTETDPLFTAWDKDYNDLINQPAIPIVPTNVGAYINDAGYLTSFTETDPLFTAWDKDYNDLINQPAIPTVPTNVSAYTNDAGYLTSYTETQNISNVLAQGTDAGNNQIVNVSQQGIGTATPNASAALDVTSTTQGFLPPRMTQIQRNAITPVEGLIIYNSTSKKPNYHDGMEWKTFDGTSAMSIGDYYQGGIIAYILQPGDPGYIAGETHGIIAAQGDQSTSAGWGCYGTAISGSDDIAIGTGAQNTIDIENGCTTSGTAADICANLVLGGYSDWYLPSKDELNKLYINRVAVGDFASAIYWSSSEYAGNASSYVWVQNFSNGNQNYYPKYGTIYVRAIRDF